MGLSERCSIVSCKCVLRQGPQGLAFDVLAADRTCVTFQSGDVRHGEGSKWVQAEGVCLSHRLYAEGVDKQACSGLQVYKSGGMSA